MGRLLAEAVLVFDDGREHPFPIRRRFEVCAPTTEWGHRALLALAHPQMVPNELNGPLERGTEWGRQQTVVAEEGGAPWLWICALRNPEPARAIKALQFKAAGEDLLAVCGVTLFHGKENPLRYDRRSIYRIALPEPGAKDRWHASVDLGVVARQYTLPEFAPGEWLASAGAGLGSPAGEGKDGRFLYAEVSASPEATLTLEDRQTGRQHAARAELVERDRAWVHARVVDRATGRPVPARLAFRSREGRYIPPYGHRTEINAGWFQDYGADVRVGGDSFAYVDGEFQVELPTGEVYVEVNKGFEYQPVRQKLQIDPSRRELTIEIGKHADLRAQGWVTADTHVHFLSPSTAILEGQAEGLNLINLLAAQWGDLYTNVGDLAHGPVTSRDGETMVWPGTENRHHLMGHIGLLGGKGKPVFPLAGGFPYGYDEAYLGGPAMVEHVGVGGRLPRPRGRDHRGPLSEPAGRAGRGHRARKDRCGGSADAPVAISGRELPGVVPVSELRLPAAHRGRDGQDERQRGGGPLADLCAHRGGGVQLRRVGQGGAEGQHVFDHRPVAAAARGRPRARR